MKININNYSDTLQPVGISDLGTIVYDNIKFLEGNYTDIDGNRQRYEEVKLDAASFTVNRSKNIVVSNVSGRNGSIYEYVSASDYQITINAILTSSEAITATAAGTAIGLTNTVNVATGLIGANLVSEPIEELNKLKRLESSNDTVQIRSKILQNVFDITEVIIRNVSYEKYLADSWSVKIECTQDQKKDFKTFG